MKIYLDKEDFNIDKSCIFIAPTGTGKTKALIEYIKDKKEQCVFVCPINSLSRQVYERGDKYFKLINCETRQISLLADIHTALSQKKSIIISLATFINFKEMFYNYNVYIDECHFLIEYNNLMNTEGLAEDIRNKKFKKIIGITATGFGLSKLLKLDEIKPNVKPKSIKHIELGWMEYFKLENFVAVILEFYKKHGKLVVLHNNVMLLEQIKNELTARNILVKMYTSENKEVKIINEHFITDFDILLCTSALTTGVSIQDNYYSLYIVQSFDTANTIPQFFSRNRNENLKGCILKKYYYNSSDFNEFELYEHDFYSKTEINDKFTETIYNKLVLLNMNITKNMLNQFINTSNDYVFYYGNRYNQEVKLLSEQKYLDVIENEKEYFVNNVIPKFNKSNYIKLYRIYQIYDAIVYGYSEDEIISNYAEIYISNVGNFIKDREYFFNFNFEKVKDYKKDKALSVAKKSTTESVDKKLFEETFLDKVYNKSEFKNFCTKEFALKSEIFKNLNTINEFLRNIGYTIKRTRNGHIVRKL